MDTICTEGPLLVPLVAPHHLRGDRGTHWAGAGAQGVAQGPGWLLQGRFAHSSAHRVSLPGWDNAAKLLGTDSSTARWVSCFSRTLGRWRKVDLSPNRSCNRVTPDGEKNIKSWLSSHV